ncbi:DUF1345 domain-containing protein [Pedobacter duraquae]|uniref:Putative membrane protein n=1 Tax=Pedobacter duraquae TaxID=425511 RepID=A0A4R6ISD8_9SPHI|nr:DUF1345 domain-containing protein [Pedobacter duraquae]TDO24795.1 putative membrane protein [Pedobacter duraquae]
MKLIWLDAHHKLIITVIIAAITFGLTYGKVGGGMQFMIVWVAYALSQILLSWITVLAVHPIEMQQQAKLQDSSRTLIFLVVLGAALASLFVVLLLLKSTKELSGWDLRFHILMSIASVMCSWIMVHTLFVFRYAHLYYGDPEKKGHKFAEGLQFPEEKEPDYLDFCYFSFVIGMTFQVSDVEISSRRIRRLALMHSMIAFGFNTVIVALSINIISGITAK